MKRWLPTLVALPLLLAGGFALAQGPAAPSLRLTPDAKFAINEVLPIELSALQRGSGIGAAAMPLADGTQRALEVRVTAQVRDGQPVATRALAGRNGFTPPM